MLDILTERKAIVKLKCRPLRPDQFQAEGRTEEWEYFSINVLSDRIGHDHLQFFARTKDPILFLLNENVYGCAGCPHWRADRERAVAFDDQRDGFAFTACEFVNLNWHDKKKNR